jgi:uncharacterized membrane protein YoaK (UPF0700 family)/anti-anti-sigma regulatory factor
MFVSQAHSFQQQAKLAVTLAWVGGYTNILTIITCGTVTSHASGTTSNLGRDVFAGAWWAAGFAFFLLATFFLGAAVSGLCTETGRRRGWESVYVLPMIVEAALLAAFAVVLEVGGPAVDAAAAAAGVTGGGPRLFLLVGLAATAMGLQNATITRISSGVVRTTHVTGVLTDLGHEFVQFLYWLSDRRRDVPPGDPRAFLHSVYTHPTARHLAILAAILLSFALGAGLGTLAYAHFPRLAMFPPVGFLLWIIYQDVARPIAEIEPFAMADAGAAGGVVALPPRLAVFHLRKDHDRHGRVHRLPNLLQWSERLPAAVQVVILDLGEVTRLDANAAIELKTLLARLEGQGRQLVIAGVNEHFHLLHLAGADDLLNSDNVCSDLELAIARGLNLLDAHLPPVPRG